MPLQTTTKTGSDVAEYVKRQFGDEAGVQVTDADILRWINDGQFEIVATNKILKGKAKTDLISGQRDYDFPMAKIIDIDSIHVKGVPVQHMQFPDVEQYIAGEDPSNIRTGQPKVWYEYGGQITFWPTPDEDVTEGITVFYIKEPKSLTTLSETLSIPDRYYTALQAYVMGQAYEMDEDWQAAAAKVEQFSGSLTAMASEEENFNNLAYPMITFVDW